MPSNSDSSGDREPVGIEILIIFLAMILVSAVAAGVLINTTDVLQREAAASTGDPSERVSNRIIVLDAVGRIDSAGERLTAVNFTIMRSPGAGEIDLSAATVEYIGPFGEATLVHTTGAADSSADPPLFSTSSVTDPDSSLPVLNSREDRLRLTITLNSSSGALQPLPAGEEATVKIVTPGGGIYTYVVDVPDSLPSDQGGNVSV